MTKTSPATGRPSLIERLWPSSGAGRTVAFIIAGVVALTASAKLQLPFWPVPMTLRSLVVLRVDVTCGARFGAATVLAYLFWLDQGTSVC